MKKIFLTLVLTLMIATLVVVPASAKQNKVNIKGEVLSVENGIITVETTKGETLTIILPEGFDIDLQVGAIVLIKGTVNADGSIQANFVKEVGAENDDDDNGKKPDKDDKTNNGKKPDNDNENKLEGSKDNSAFCAEGKQDRPHPFSPIMAERYGVTEEWVTEYFCQGYSIGAIMLALKTSQMDGMNVDPATLLAGRAEGNGWGQIWKNLGLIGSEKDGKSPPGLLKRPAHAGPKK